jgi:hypothetical protein
MNSGRCLFHVPGGTRLGWAAFGRDHVNIGVNANCRNGPVETRLLRHLILSYRLYDILFPNNRLKLSNGIIHCRLDPRQRSPRHMMEGFSMI